MHENRIKRVPLNTSSFWQQTDGIVMTMLDNPSVCMPVFDPVQVRRRIVCDCTEGYFGTDSCEPVDQFQVLPSIISEVQGLHLTGPMLVNGTADLLRPVAKATFDPNSPLTLFINAQIYSVEFITGTYNISLLTIYSVWKLPRGQTTYPWNATTPVLRGGLFDEVAWPVSVPRDAFNIFMPVLWTFTCNGCEVLLQRLGLAFDNKTGTIAGVVNSTGHFEFVITAIDTFTSEPANVSVVTLELTACGLNTCTGHGTCSAPPTAGNNIIYDPRFVCNCTLAFEGTRCEASRSDNKVITSSESKLPDWAIGVIVGLIVLILLLLLATFCYFRQKHRRERDKPFNFAQQMKRLKEIGLIQVNDGSSAQAGSKPSALLGASSTRELVTPFELKRSRIKILDKLGSGAYGTVHKVGVSLYVCLFVFFCVFVCVMFSVCVPCLCVCICFVLCLRNLVCSQTHTHTHTHTHTTLETYTSAGPVGQLRSRSHQTA